MSTTTRIVKPDHNYKYYYTISVYYIYIYLGFLHRSFLGGPCAINSSCITNVSNPESKDKTCCCAATLYHAINPCTLQIKLV